MATQQISIELVFQRSQDGRYSVTSEDVPGFRMAGFDINAIQADLNEVVSDLLLHNSGFAVTDVKWIPSLEDVKRRLQAPSPQGKARYLVSGTMAA